MKRNSLLKILMTTTFMCAFYTHAFALETNLGIYIDDDNFAQYATQNQDGTYSISIPRYSNAVYTGSLNGGVFTINNRTITSGSSQYEYTGLDENSNNVNYTGTQTTMVQTTYDSNGKEISNTYTQNRYPDPAQISVDRRNYESISVIQFNGAANPQNIVSASKGTAMDGLITTTYNAGNLTSFDYGNGFISYEFNSNGTIKEARIGKDEYSNGDVYYFDGNGNLINQEINCNCSNIDTANIAGQNVSAAFAEQYNLTIPTASVNLYNDDGTMIREVLESLDSEAVQKMIEGELNIGNFVFAATSDHSADVYFGDFQTSVSIETDAETEDPRVVVGEAAWNQEGNNLMPVPTEENMQAIKDYLECLASDEDTNCGDIYDSIQFATYNYDALGNWAYRDGYIYTLITTANYNASAGIIPVYDEIIAEIDDNSGNNGGNVSQSKPKRTYYTIEEAMQHVTHDNKNRVIFTFK